MQLPLHAHLHCRYVCATDDQLHSSKRPKAPTPIQAPASTAAKPSTGKATDKVQVGKQESAAAPAAPMPPKVKPAANTKQPAAPAAAPDAKRALDTRQPAAPGGASKQQKQPQQPADKPKRPADQVDQPPAKRQASDQQQQLGSRPEGQRPAVANAVGGPGAAAAAAGSADGSNAAAAAAAAMQAKIPTASGAGSQRHASGSGPFSKKSHTANTGSRLQPKPPLSAGGSGSGLHSHTGLHPGSSSQQQRPHTPGGGKSHPAAASRLGSNQAGTVLQGPSSTGEAGKPASLQRKPAGHQPLQPVRPTPGNSSHEQQQRQQQDKPQKQQPLQQQSPSPSPGSRAAAFADEFVRKPSSMSPLKQPALNGVPPAAEQKQQGKQPQQQQDRPKLKQDEQQEKQQKQKQQQEKQQQQQQESKQQEMKQQLNLQQPLQLDSQQEPQQVVRKKPSPASKLMRPSSTKLAEGRAAAAAAGEGRAAGAGSTQAVTAAKLSSGGGSAAAAAGSGRLQQRSIASGSAGLSDKQQQQTGAAAATAARPGGTRKPDEGMQRRAAEGSNAGLKPKQGEFGLACTALYCRHSLLDGVGRIAGAWQRAQSLCVKHCRACLAPFGPDFLGSLLQNRQKMSNASHLQHWTHQEVAPFS